MNSENLPDRLRHRAANGAQVESRGPWPAGGRASVTDHGRFWTAFGLVCLLAVAAGTWTGLGFSTALGSPTDLTGMARPSPDAPTLYVQQPSQEEQEDPEAEEPQENEEDAQVSEAYREGLRPLTAEEINRIRYLELRGMHGKAGPPDRVSVKISKETVDDFLVEMEGHKDFEGDKTRREYRRLTAPQKLHYIAYYKGAKYADRVKITSDPEVFVDFKKHVMPTVLRSCATAGCHGVPGNQAQRFHLFNDPKRTASTTYADYLMLHEFEHKGHRIIDRARPERSLLLTYMLPTKDVLPELRHPGRVKLKPGFRTRGTRDYKLIEDWIRSLLHPAEDYGVSFFGIAPASRPVEEPDTKLEREASNP